MREPTLTMRPPISDGSTLASSVDVLAERRLAAPPCSVRDLRVGQRLGDWSPRPSTSPRALRRPARGTPRSCRAARTAGGSRRRRLMKLAARPPMPALSSTAAIARTCSSAEKTGLRTRRRRSSLSSSSRRSGRDRVATASTRLCVPGEFEQRRGVAPRHAGHVGRVACHEFLSRECAEERLGDAAKHPAKPLDCLRFRPRKPEPAKRGPARSGVG